MALRKGFRIDLVPPNDDEIPEEVRDRASRWANLLGTTAAIIVVPIAFATYWGSLAGSPKLGFLVGLGGAAVLATLILPRMLISNPEWGAYVTLDAFKGSNVPYGPGLHPAHWWEERNADGNYSLEVITKTFSVMVPTKTSQVEVSGTFQYQIDLAWITNFIGVDETTVEMGFTGFIQSFLMMNLADATAEIARSTVNDLNDKLAEEFLGVAVPTGETVTEFERENGIRAISVIIGAVKLPVAVQNTRDAVDQGHSIFEVVAASLNVSPTELQARLDDGRISKAEFQEYRREALALAGKASLEFKRIDGTMPAALADTLSGGSGKKSS